MEPLTELHTKVALSLTRKYEIRMEVTDRSLADEDEIESLDQYETG